MSTKCFLPTGMLGAILLFSACSPEKQSAGPQSENAAEAAAKKISVNPASDLPKWITAEAGPHRDCPLSAAAGTSTNPGFDFNGTTDAPDFNCHQTGPFSWQGKEWYVQRIHSLTTNPASPKACSNAGLSSPCLFDGTRVCSKQGANGPTPAGTDAGPGGCGVYPPSVKFRKKP